MWHEVRRRGMKKSRKSEGSGEVRNSRGQEEARGCLKECVCVGGGGGED